MISNDTLMSDFASGSHADVHDVSPASSHSESATETGTSFFRGAALGLAIAIPAWIWLIILVLR